jgi:hypothetical protein
VSLASSPPSQPKSKTDLSATPIKTRTEQQEKFVRTLQASLSEKISEKVPVLDMPASLEHSEDLFEISTPSISSTVSSSGDVEGVYTLYSDEMTQSSDGEEEVPGMYSCVCVCVCACACCVYVLYVIVLMPECV